MNSQCPRCLSSTFAAKQRSGNSVFSLRPGCSFCANKVVYWSEFVLPKQWCGDKLPRLRLVTVREPADAADGAGATGGASDKKDAS